MEMMKSSASTRVACLVALATSTVSLACGCGDLGTRRVPPKAEINDPVSEQKPEVSPAPVAPQPPDTEQPAKNVPDAAATAQAAERPVRLSAGVALPQSVPSGTAIGFSVDYTFTSGGPQSALRYVWVIRAAAADQTWEQAVQLKQQGQLQTFVTKWRPEQGPFETFIAEVGPDDDRRPISSVEPLKRDAW